MLSARALAVTVILAAMAGCGRSGCQSDPAEAPAATPQGPVGRPPIGPSVSVVVSLPGASPEEMHAQVAEPIIAAVMSLPGLAHVQTRAVEGTAVITAELEPGSDVYAARMALSERLTRVRPQLPEAAGPPYLTAVRQAQGVALRYALGSDRHDPSELRRLHEELVVRELVQIPGMADVVSCGGAETVVHIDVDPARLSAFGLRLDDVLASTLPVSQGLLRKAAELEELGQSVVRAEPVVTQLRDVATIRLGHEPPPCTATGPGGAPVVVGFAYAAQGADQDEVAERAKERLAHAALPEGVRIELLPDHTATVVLAAPAGPAGRHAEAEQVVSRTIHAALPDDVGSILVSGVTPITPPGTIGLLVADARAVSRVVHRLDETPGIAVVAVDSAHDAGASLPLLIVGDDAARRAREAVAAARRLPDVVGAWAPPDAGTPTISVKVDRAAAARHGVRVADITEAVTAATIGVRVGALGPLGPEVRVRVPPPDGDVGRVSLLTEHGMVPVGSVAAIVQTLAPSVVTSRDGRRVWPLVLRLSPGASPKAVRAELEAALEGTPLLRSPTNCSSPAAGCW